MRPLAVWLDGYVEEACPGLDQALAMHGALVLRCFERTPSPAASRRLEDYRQVVVLGGADGEMRVARVELATTTLTWPVIVLAPASERNRFGAGVVDVVAPQPAEALAQRITLMSEVPIVSVARPRAAGAALPGSPAARSTAGEQRLTTPPVGTPAPERAGADPSSGGAVDALGIVSSTGGSFVVADLLRALRRPSGRAVLLAQHLEAEFVPFFAEWLAHASQWPVRVVNGPEPLVADQVYLAMGGRDLLVEGGEVTTRAPSSHWIPCGDALLESVARARGSRAVGLVLSGMGGDGSLGLAAVARQGGQVFCQQPESSVVSSMPLRALQVTPAARALAPDALAVELALESEARRSGRVGA